MKVLQSLSHMWLLLSSLNPSSAVDANAPLLTTASSLKSIASRSHLNHSFALAPSEALNSPIARRIWLSPDLLTDTAAPRVLQNPLS